MSDLEQATRAAYDAAAPAWASGPQRVYARLAAALLDHSPVPLDGVALLDVGAATGVLGREAKARGARCVDIDVAVGMLRGGRRQSRRVVGADGRALPFRSDAFDVVAGNCSLSHVADPERMVAEATRVTRSGGVVLFSAFPTTSMSHRAWSVVESVLTESGYERPEWYRHLKAESEPRVGSADALAHLAGDAGLAEVSVVSDRVATDVADPEALVDWRLGMAQHAQFLADTPPAQRARIRSTAIARLGDHPEPLDVDLLVLVGQA